MVELLHSPYLILSAAFDTINHSIIMDRLSVWYDVSGIALSWFRSYLRVKIGDCFSSPLNISCGVPQGSVLGPLIFTLYTTPLSLVINRHHLSHHLYADDTQIYISLSTSKVVLYSSLELVLMTYFAG